MIGKIPITNCNFNNTDRRILFNFEPTVSHSQIMSMTSVILAKYKSLTIEHDSIKGKSALATC